MGVESGGQGALAVSQAFETCDERKFGGGLLKLIALNFVEKTTTVKWLSLKNGRF